MIDKFCPINAKILETLKHFDGNSEISRQTANQLRSKLLSFVERGYQSVDIHGKDLALASMLIALNVALGGLVAALKLPIFLDSIGTILAVMLLGWRYAVVVGTLSFVIASALVSPVYIYFIGTQVAIATFVWLAARYFGVFASLWRLIPTGILLGVVAGIVSAPVIVFVFGGVAGSGRDLVTAALIKSGEQIFNAVLLSGAASEPIDKTVQILIAFFILQSLPKRVLSGFSNSLLERNKLL